MKIVRAASLILLMSLASACTTHLESSRPSANGITNGVVYYLPRVNYDVQVSWILSSCPKLDVGAPTFDTTAKATASTIAGEPVSISYEQLSSLSKTTDFAVELYPTGILKSVNATVDDQTAAIAAEGVKAAVGIAKMVIGVPSLTAAAEGGLQEQTSLIACTSNAEKALASLAVQRDAIKKTAADLKKATKAATDFEADHKETARAAAVAAAAAKLATAQREAQEKSDAAVKAVADTVAKITVNAQFSYSPGSESGGAPMLVGIASARQGKVEPNTVLEFRAKTQSGKWIVLPLGPSLGNADPLVAQAFWEGKPPSADAVVVAQSVWDGLKGQLDVKSLFNPASVVIDSQALVALSSPKLNSLDLAENCADAKIKNCGILYRTKAPARTHICKYMTPADIDPSKRTCLTKMSDDPTLLFAEDRAIPQLGQLASLPFHNGPFENNSLTAEFSDDGALTKVGYKKPTAQGVVIGQALNNGISGAGDIFSYAKGSQLRSLQNQKAIADAQAALATSTTSVTTAQPSEVTKITNETSLIDAERLRVIAQIALKQKQAELNALNSSVTPQ